MILDFASLFTWDADKADIEAERQRLEQNYQRKIEVHEIDHPMISGRRCTRVSWREE